MKLNSLLILSETKNEKLKEKKSLSKSAVSEHVVLVSDLAPSKFHAEGGSN